MFLLKALYILVLSFSIAHGSEMSWESLPLDQKAVVLDYLEFMVKSNLPNGTRVINYSKITIASSGDLETTNVVHRDYIKRIRETFDQVVSDESIYQSPYNIYGEPEIIALYLLVDESEAILGSYLALYQEGRDEDGNEADISWTASVRFDSKGDVFLDENSQPYDELYYEWTGH